MRGGCCRSEPKAKTWKTSTRVCADNLRMPGRRRSNFVRCGHCTSPVGFPIKTYASCLTIEDEHLRAWAVTLLCEDRQPPADGLTRLRKLAASGDSPLVRLSLASALAAFVAQRSLADRGSTRGAR